MRSLPTARCPSCGAIFPNHRELAKHERVGCHERDPDEAQDSLPAATPACSEAPIGAIMTVLEPSAVMCLVCFSQLIVLEQIVLEHAKHIAEPSTSLGSLVGCSLAGRWMPRQRQHHRERRLQHREREKLTHARLPALFPSAQHRP